ncbi:MAG: SIR2 family protein [Alphaproteobacteria bacterium]|nr:SIR2 family protein [Alphaproteobacteria bacterium]
MTNISSNSDVQNPSIDPILADKIKKEQDLFSFIENRIDKVSNYNLFLGSGASITSGILSAQQLVEQWRREVFYTFDECKDKEFSIENAKAVFAQKFGREYDPNKEYSFLFKQKYHLPAQRRNFVEKTMKDATPSIGYRYLANLVRANYFNTIFTTNFDDLIEQSLLSSNLDIKPIMCSHDASIMSIPVVSNRPKIIKLHGDFLFDDIKTTVSETARLEENMKNKFEEFLKNFGLIVIGYSGCDDSIMDILENIIKKDGYLDGGLYWCTRNLKEIENNHRLKKLLLNDKAFIIQIEGFDEFFAELNHFISDKDYINDPFQKNKEDICSLKDIDKTIELFGNNELIKQDCENYKKKLPEILSKTLKTISDKSEYKNADDKEDLINLSSLTEDSILKEYIDKLNTLLKEEAPMSSILDTIKEIEKKSYKFSDIRLFNAIERAKIALLEKKNDNDGIIQTLLDLKQFNESRDCFYENVYLDLANHYINRKEWDNAIKTVDKALLINQQNDKLYLMLAKAQEAKLHNDFKEKTEGLALSIKDNYIKSIKYNPSVRVNTAYRYFTDFMFGNNKIKFTDDEFNELVLKPFSEQSISDADYPHIIAQKVLFDYNKNEDSFSILDELYKNRERNKIINYQASLFRNYLKVCKATKRTAEFNRCVNEIPTMFQKTIWYVKIIANYALSNEKNINKAIQIIHDNIDIDVDNELLFLLLKFKLYAKDFQFVEDNLNKLKGDDLNLMKIDLYIHKDDKEKLYEIAKSTYEKSNKNLHDLVIYSYHLLICEKYRECYDLLNSDTHNDSILEINYELARQGINKSVRQDKIHSIYEKDEKQVKAAACVLLNKYTEAISILEKLITEDFEVFYYIQTYPVFKPIIKDLSKIINDSRC